MSDKPTERGVEALVDAVAAVIHEIEDPRTQRPGMQRRRLWADRLRAALRGNA